MPCRCAFVPVDDDNPTAYNNKLVRHANLTGLIWADSTISGGLGPLQDLPDTCHSIQFNLETTLHPHPGQHPTAFSAANSAIIASTLSVGQQTFDAELRNLVLAWQQSVDGSSLLPFCYVMYTSGSTGQPLGVCGTEAGWSTVNLKLCMQQSFKALLVREQISVPRPATQRCCHSCVTQWLCFA